MYPEIVWASGQKLCTCDFASLLRSSFRDAVLNASELRNVEITRNSENRVVCGHTINTTNSYCCACYLGLVIGRI